MLSIMKNYLLWLLAVPLMSPLLWIASASWSSDCEIQSCSFSVESSQFEGDQDKYVCSMTQDNVNFWVKYSPVDINIQPSDWTVDCSNWFCTVSGLYDYNEKLYFYVENWNLSDLTLSNCAYVPSSCSLTWVDDSPSAWDSDSDSVFPELSVPWSFTSWMTQLVENFGWTIANWLPVVILVALWITAIFALFRVVRWYARSSFRW